MDFVFIPVCRKCVYIDEIRGIIHSRSQTWLASWKKLDFSETKPTLSQIHLLLFVFSIYDPKKPASLKNIYPVTHNQQPIMSHCTEMTPWCAVAVNKGLVFFGFFLLWTFILRLKMHNQKGKKKNKTGQFQWALWGRFKKNAWIWMKYNGVMIHSSSWIMKHIPLSLFLHHIFLLYSVLHVPQLSNYVILV